VRWEGDACLLDAIGRVTQAQAYYDPDSYRRFISPQKNWVQQTFGRRLCANANARTPVAIVNPALGAGLGLSVRYDPKTLPRYIEWRMMGEGQYAVGMEPCSNGFGREETRRRGELIELAPGASRQYEIEIGVLDGPEEIAAFRAEVENARPSA